MRAFVPTDRTVERGRGNLLRSKTKLMIICRTLVILCFIGMTCIACVRTGNAAPLQEQEYPSGQGKNWSVRIGSLGTHKPAYEGSDDYEWRAFPLIDVTVGDTFFLHARTGAGVYIWNRNDCKIGLAVGYSFGREEDDSSDLRGLGDIDDGATANLLFEWAAGEVNLRARYEEQITGHGTGFQVHLGLGHDLHVADKTILKPSIRTTYASADYMEEYFGISPGQSTRSGLPLYDAAGGFKSIGFHMMAIHRLDRHWEILAGAGYDRLVGDAGDSPVVKNENQYRISIGVSYMF